MGSVFPSSWNQRESEGQKERLWLLHRQEIDIDILVHDHLRGKNRVEDPEAKNLFIRIIRGVAVHRVLEGEMTKNRDAENRENGTIRYREVERRQGLGVEVINGRDLGHHLILDRDLDLVQMENNGNAENGSSENKKNG